MTSRLRPILSLIVVLAIALCATGPVLAADAKGELSFSAALWNPNDGGTSWSARAEYLIPLGHLYFGPSGELFDGPGTDGGAVGVAGEFHLGKKCGPGFGAAAYKPTGDTADAADLLYEVRAIFECGSGSAAVKFTGRQVWSKAADGAVTDPDGTQVDAGVVWRF